MADLTQQYLDILRGYGVDTSTLQYADPAKLKRIVDQTRQASDTGGGAMAVGQQAAQQAAKDVIGGTTPRKGLEDLLKEAHTGPSITQAGSDAALPMSEVPAMSAPRELAIRQDPGGPQSQGDINRPTSLGVKTSTATLRPNTVTGEVPAPEMDYDRDIQPDKIAGENINRPTSLDVKTSTATLRPDKVASEVPAPDMAFEDSALDFDPTAGRYQEHPILMEETVVTPESEEIKGEPSFLSRLGGLAKNNPELMAQIAQAGGGLMQNIAQGRAQKKADAKTRGAMAQSNLIGALTGGKSRPAVMREEAEQGGLLARLGQAVQAGGSVAGGEMQRRTVEEDKEQDVEFQERALGQKDEEIRIKDAAQQTDKAYKEAIAGIKELSAGLGGAATQKQIKQMQGTLNVIGKFKKDIMGIEGIGGIIEGQATRLPLLGKMLNEDAQRYQDQRAMLVGTVAKIINGGGSQVSNFEQQQAEKVVPDLTSPRDVGEFGQAKFTQLEDIINLRIDALRGGGTGSIDMQVAEMMGDPDKPTKIDPADQGTMEQALNGDAEAERLIRAKYPNLMD
jgi:hypothetical protein